MNTKEGKQQADARRRYFTELLRRWVLKNHPDAYAGLWADAQIAFPALRKPGRPRGVKHAS